MTETKKILGQSSPSTGVLTDVYTVGAATQAVVSTITICNRGTSLSSFRVSVAQGGAADTTKQYLYYDVPINGNDTFAATLGITLNTGDVVRFQSGSNTLTFNIFGVEIS